MIVESLAIIELKAGDGLIEEHEAQLINYLKATNIEAGLLLNLGKTPQVKRKAFSNAYKITLSAQNPDMSWKSAFYQKRSKWNIIQ